MQLSEVQKQIIDKNIDKYFLFFGEEVAIMDIYLNELYGVMEAEVIHCDTVQEAFARMVQKRLAGGKRCFVVRNDKEFFRNDKVWHTVFSQAEKGNDYLILIYATIDKRSKYYKRNTQKLVEFEKLSIDILANYIDNELPGVSHKYRVKLAEVCDRCYSRILLECDKVRHFVSVNPNYTNQSALAYLIETGVIFQPIGDITFKFTDAILTRNFADTALYLQQARQKQEPEVMVLFILYNGFKQILMVQGLGKNQNDACKRTGLTAWQVKMAKEKQGHYSISELVNALEVIRFVEKGVKTGQVDSDVSLEYAIINIM